MCLERAPFAVEMALRGLIALYIVSSALDLRAYFCSKAEGH